MPEENGHEVDSQHFNPLEKGFARTLPEGANASPIYRDPKYGRAPGVYGVKVWGTFMPDAGNPLSGGNLNLCYIPHGVILSNFIIFPNGVTGTLQDSCPTPTVYATVTGNVVVPQNMTIAQGVNWGTMYFTTPRAVGKDGCQVVQWEKGTLLQISNASGGTPGNPLVFMIEWSPVYDGGV